MYKLIRPYNESHLKVSELHTLYYEESGNPQGSPVVFIHGGPGGGTIADYRRFFDPKKYRIILFDQRGCGKSTPHAELEENTTWHLVSDMELLRKKLNIEKWHVFGGSWGSTLALCYAVKHPEQVTSLVLRGLFLCRQKEIQWFYQYGASEIFPDAWDHYLQAIPEEEHGDLVAAYHKRLTSDDKSVQLKAAKAWSVWEGSTSMLIPAEQMIKDFGGDEFALAFARIESHYFVNKIFVESDDWLINEIQKIRHIPCDLVHGRYDVVCALSTAWEMKKAWPEMKLHITADAGHSAFETGTQQTLTAIMDSRL